MLMRSSGKSNGGANPLPKWCGGLVRLYAPGASWTAALGLGLASYYALAIGWALTHDRLASVPWMGLFFAGFAYVGASSLRRPRPQPRAGAPRPEVEVVVEAAA